MDSQLALQLERPALEAARAMGAEGMRRAEQRAERESPGFSAEAFRFLKGYVSTHYSRPFAGEDVVDMARTCGLVAPDSRAWGGVFLKAKRAGLIRLSNEWYPRRNGHGTQARMWECA